MVADPAEPLRYASDHIVLRLSVPLPGDRTIEVWQPARPGNAHYLEELVFLGTGAIVSLGLPEGVEVESTADMQDWFDVVAGILRRDGADILAGRAGAWERLETAANERYRRLAEEAEAEQPIPGPDGPSLTAPGTPAAASR